MSPHRIDTLPPSPVSLPSYGISDHGFLPAEAPLSRLPHPHFEPWETIARSLPRLLETQQLRQMVDELPVLETLYLVTESEWQRAYSILAILTQSYVWQGPQPSQRIPPAISIPFLKVAAHLEVNPVATYAALNLWNWLPVAEGVDLCQPENTKAALTQTGTDDESWFFTISNAMEARAGPIVKKMLEAMEAVNREDSSVVAESLLYFQHSIDDIGRLLERMDERCRPQVFYFRIRPFLAGSMNMESAGLPHGIFFDEGDGKGSWRKYRGGSNGQSSLLQFCDAVLGVSHERSGGFYAEMRRYMPGPHARFLDDVEAMANIRPYVDSHQDNVELQAAYNEAVASLSGFRDKHIALVTRYIIIPSRSADHVDATLGEKLMTKTAIATRSVLDAASMQDLVGTGGTKLIPFLRTARDETREAAVAR